MPRSYQMQTYELKSKGRWNWRVVAPNGNITAVSGESDGYLSESAAYRSGSRHMKVMATKAVIIRRRTEP